LIPNKANRKPLEVIWYLFLIRQLNLKLDCSSVAFKFNLMYKVLTDSFGTLERYKIICVETQEFYAVIPAYGALIHQIGLKLHTDIIQVLDHETTAGKIKENRWFKSCKLSPFPNRVDGGKYHFEGQPYQFPCNSPEKIHAIHGFIFDRPFEILGFHESSGILELKYAYPGDFPGYPFRFDMYLTYQLQDHVFSCKTQVINTGEQPLPYGDGWHPYFRIGEKADDWVLELPKCSQILTNDVMIPTGEVISPNKLPKRYELQHKEFDTGFGITNPDQNSEASIALTNPVDEITLEIRQQTGGGKYNFFQVFIPPSRKSVAIEPMTCMADAFNNLSGLIVLEPGQCFEGEYLVRLK
jgi:aldose 1-epimerase